MLIIAVSCDISHIGSASAFRGYIYNKPSGKQLELPKDIEKDYLPPLENDYLPPVSNDYLPPLKDYLPPQTEIEADCFGDECNNEQYETTVANEYDV